MSWDIYVLNFPKEARSAKDVPDDYKPEPIGSRSEVIESIKSVLPNIDFSQTYGGILSGNGFSIEVRLDDTPIVESFTLGIYGHSEEVFSIISSILEVLQVRGFDTHLGDFFDEKKSRLS